MLVLLFSFPVLAQSNIPQPPPSTESPNDAGVRLTPGMARAVAQLYTKEVLMRRYQLDEAKSKDASEAIARRLMATAHTIDAQGADFLQYVIGQSIQSRVENRSGPPITPEMGKGIGERLLPMLPAVRDLVSNVGQDIRPMLSLKEQLRLTGDMMLAGTALNALEQNMQLWSRGEVDPLGNPFESKDNTVEKEPDGKSRVLKNARGQAQRGIDSGKWDTWKNYVEEAKKFYGFDASQTATAESLMREFTERAKAVTQDPQWRDRKYRGGLWSGMLWGLNEARNGPLPYLLEAQTWESNLPIDALDQEFKHRIDEIPTAAQRTAAEERITALLAEQGLSGTTEPAP